MIEQLEFVRPDWFYAFIPLALFIALMLRRHKSSLGWKSVCDANLLPHVLTESTGKKSHVPLILAAIATSLCIIAAAGPVLKKLPQPVFREQSALVIMLDLSQSMDATDLRPSRIERAKLKLLDILKARKGGQTALVVYAAHAFTVTPLTDDTNTIANLVPTLATQLMPAQGSSAFVALKTAAELLKQAGSTQGEGLLITDGISSKDKSAVEAFKEQGHRLSILGVGTGNGSPIPLPNGGFLQDSEGAIVIPKLPVRELQKIALVGGGLYINIQADDSDVNRLNNLFSSRKITNESENKTLGELELTADIWQEEGPWLLLLALPFVALWSRKGWLLCVPVIALTLPQPSYALNTDNLWQSSDQKAMRDFNAGDTQSAAEKFKNERWKSSAYYRAGNYEKSVETLNKPSSSDDFYNKGNALAKLGRYDEAIKAYDEAISLDESNEDAAYNREQVEKAKQEQQGESSQDKQEEGEDQSEQQDNQQSSDSDEKSDSDEQSDQEKQSDQQQSDQQQSGEDSQQNNEEESKDSQQADSTENDDSSSEENKKSTDEEIKQALEDAQQQDQALEEDENEEQNDQSLSMNQNSEDQALSEDQQITEQWLRRIPDDPGQLLRRKFQHQYKYAPKQNTDDQPW